MISNKIHRCQICQLNCQCLWTRVWPCRPGQNKNKQIKYESCHLKSFLTSQLRTVFWLADKKGFLTSWLKKVFSPADWKWFSWPADWERVSDQLAEKGFPVKLTEWSFPDQLIWSFLTSWLKKVFWHVDWKKFSDKVF